VWHAAGRNPLAGDHRGTDEVLGYFGRTLELTGGTFRVELHDVVANVDDHAVGLHVKVVSERLGHASIAFTLDTYAHVLPGMQAETAEIVAPLAVGSPSWGARRP
jgi:hypothetical protein